LKDRFHKLDATPSKAGAAAAALRAPFARHTDTHSDEKTKKKIGRSAGARASRRRSTSKLGSETFMQMSSLRGPTRRSAEQQDDMGTALLANNRCQPSGSVYLYSLAAIASVGGFLFGYDTGVVSGAMELIRRAWNLNDVQHEAIVSSTTGFAAIGAMLSGSANRILGRKPVLVAAALVFTVGAVSMGLSRNFNELLFGRCVVGLAVGLASSTVPLYIAELAPPNLRGLLVSVNKYAARRVLAPRPTAVAKTALSRAPGLPIGTLAVQLHASALRNPSPSRLRPHPA
jgi:hypothetical protein